jgi:hypothetical protein
VKIVYLAKANKYCVYQNRALQPQVPLYSTYCTVVDIRITSVGTLVWYHVQITRTKSYAVVKAKLEVMS